MHISHTQTNVGSIVEGVENKALFDEGFVKQLRDLVSERLVVAIRGLNYLEDSVLAKFVSQFGAPITPFTRRLQSSGVVHLRTKYKLGGDIKNRFSATSWHIDYSYLKHPAAYSSIFCVNPSGDDVKTHWYSMYGMLEGLEKRLVDGLSKRFALHYGGYDKKSANISLIARLVADKTLHPLLMRSPVNQRPVLYYNDSNVKEFVDVPPGVEAETRAKIRSQLESGSDRYTHTWRSGDLVLFDAIGGIHRRDSLGDSGIRHMKQLSVSTPILFESQAI